MLADLTDRFALHGIVPWHVPLVYSMLKKAFMEKNSERILYLSASLGHYIGDAHVPLHCTKNYNGQLTGQNGIHWILGIPTARTFRRRLRLYGRPSRLYS